MAWTPADQSHQGAAAKALTGERSDRAALAELRETASGIASTVLALGVPAAGVLSLDPVGRKRPFSSAKTRRSWKRQPSPYGPGRSAPRRRVPA
jgi:hypothetical protein